MEDRPSDNVNQAPCLAYGSVHVTPALAMLVAQSMIEPDIWERTLRHMRILIQGDLHATLQREVSVGHSKALAVGPSHDTTVVHCEASHRNVLNGELQHSTSGARLAIGLEHREDALDHLPVKETLGRDGHGPHELRAEDVAVLDDELDLGRFVGHGHEEVLLPDGVLAVGDDVGAGDGGVGGDLDGDVGVAGEGAVGGLAADGAGDARAEEVADPLGEHVLVGQVLGLVHPDVEAAVQQHHLERGPHAAVLRRGGPVRHHLHPGPAVSAAAGA